MHSLLLSSILSSQHWQAIMSTMGTPPYLPHLRAELILMIISNFDVTLDSPSKLALSQTNRALRRVVPAEPPRKDGERLLHLFREEQWHEYVLPSPFIIVFVCSPVTLQTQQRLRIPNVSEAPGLRKIPRYDPGQREGRGQNA